MRRLLIILATFLALAIVSSAQQLDSAKRVLLDEKLAEYTAAIERAGVAVQKEECDFLIGSSTDSLVRQYIALNLYDHYVTSQVMGAEAVAIHIFDTWFLSGKVSMGDDMEMLTARVHADFNRQSQIGMPAPALTMYTMEGDAVDLFVPGSVVKDGKRHSVLFFYDTDCSKCKVESILLSHLLEDEDYPIDFYAIYTGDDQEEWRKYVSERFALMTSRMKITHLWDPTMHSDFQRKYGILQTPRMYLIRPDGVIKGRGLDTYALALMLNEIFAHPDLSYGNPQMEPFFDELLSMKYADADGQPTEYGVMASADYLAVSQLHAGDTTMCRQMLGDFLYYLAPRTGQVMKEGTKYLIDEYILGRSDIWTSADDTLKIIGFAEILDDLLSKSLPGSRIADLKVPGEYLTKAKTQSKVKNLRKLKGELNIVIFHTNGCNICAAEIEAARTHVSAGKNVFLVNVDEILASDPALASRVFEKFDLSTLPYIIITDKKGYILSRYVTLQ
ncbi:MAG: thioredoxin family protein [Bacteroidales bacterium]|nr:thioredoxin family protein [Bacteroidales bacterium]